MVNDIEILECLHEIKELILAGQTNQEYPDTIMRIEECAKFLGLAKQTVYQMAAKGEIPVMRKSRRLFFSRKGIEDWLKSGRRITFEEAEQKMDKLIARK